ncbi:MAG: tetratricopeptide repeat protein [Rhodocyclaceae bacterium]
MTQILPPHDACYEKFNGVARACLDALATQAGAATHWQVFDDLMTAFDGLPEADALAATAQFMEQPGMQIVTRALARRSTERFPQSAQGWYLYGRSMLLISSDSIEARPALERAWELDPNTDALLPLCLAAAFIACKRYVDAELACREMLARDPNSADAYSNLAVALRMQYRTDEAVTAGEAALRIDPNHAHAPVNLALAMVDDERFADALSLLRELISHHPDDDRIRLPLGELELRHGIWESGWANMHARFSLPGLREQLQAREQNCGVPHWRGESLEGRTLGIWLEQGYGDAILLVRFLPLIAERVRALGGKLVFGCFGPLVELFKPLIPSDVELNVDFLRQTDFHMPLMSSCSPFKFGNDTLRGSAYLHVEGGQVVRWRKRLGVGDGRLHVALAWTGNPQQSRNDVRSLPQPQLEALLAKGNGPRDIVFHSVNPAAGEVVASLRDKGFNVVDWGSELNDFMTTAALLKAVDAVATTCTSVAHLAGAVGAPTLLMLDRIGSFIWGTEESRTPWYDSIRIVRQARFGDWSDVAARVRQELSAMKGVDELGPTTAVTAPTAKSHKPSKGTKAGRKAGKSVK